MSPMHLKSPASRLFTQPFVQAQIKENIKNFASLAFVRGNHRSPQKMFPLDDVIMITWVIVRPALFGPLLKQLEPNPIRFVTSL